MDLPKLFESRIRKDFGHEADAFLSALDQQPQTSIRLHPKKGETNPNLSPIPWSDLGFWLPERPTFALDPHFHAGAYYVQEASSMFLEEAFKRIDLPAKPLVLDLCAAPGGKSTHLLSLLDGQGLLVSNEVIQSRNAVLRENIIKWGYPNVIVTRNNPEDFKRSKVQFDLIAVDAPCSGEGMFRKDPQARKEWSEAHVDLCSLRQQKILADIWPSLKPGGHLIYSTCTFNSRENEDQILRLVNEHDAEIISLNHNHVSITNRKAGYAFYPHKTSSEGFYICVMRKPLSQNNAAKSKRSRIKIIDDPIWTDLVAFEDGALIHFNDSITLFPEAFIDTLSTINRSLNITLCGTELGHEVHGKLQLDHGLAMSVFRNTEAFQFLELNKDDALDYLRKNVPVKTGKSAKWVLASYEGIALGFLKDAGNRWNNYYPTKYRLRMGN